MMKALLVDDEFPAREELRCLLEEIGGIEVVGECEDGEEALAFLKKTPLDVIFLDIQMSVKDGLTTAWEILQLPHPPKIVFTTGYNEYAVKAFELNAVDYVMKPYSKKRLEQTVKKLVELKKAEKWENGTIYDLLAKNVVTHRGRLSVWAHDRLIVLNTSQIIFVKAEGKGKTVLYTEKGNFVTGFTLKEIEEKLNSSQFCRIHKSYLVNLEKIREVIPWFNNTYVLVLEDYTEENIPVSRHYIKKFNEKMGI
ncbi:MAG: ypdB [Peptococcaceae bacterium]|jgi:DNA-binding LytR/AlgR family response regulator|nr:ypdB [Peptococcaceae bacterium]